MHEHKRWAMRENAKERRNLAGAAGAKHAKVTRWLLGGSLTLLDMNISVFSLKGI